MVLTVPFAKHAFITQTNYQLLVSEFGFPLVIKGKFYDAKIAYTAQIRLFNILTK
jgi:hypothetical protein